MNVLELRGLALFFSAFLNLLLALFLWQRSNERKDIFWLGVTALFSGFYAFFCAGVYFFWQDDSFSSVLWYRSTWLGVLMVPPFVLFTCYFTREIDRLKLKALLLYLGSAIIVVLALTTTLFLKKINFENPNIAGIAGPLDFFGRLYILTGIVFGLYNLLKEYLKSAGFKKLQIRYFVTGTVMYALAGIIFTVVFPIFSGKSAYYDFVAFFSLIWMSLISYAILRYRLMDIRFVLGRGAVYTLSLVSTVGLASFMMFLNSRYFNTVSFRITGPFILVFSILFFQPIFRFFEKFASRYFYYTFYSYQTVLTDLGRKLTRVLDLDRFAFLVVSTLTNTMKLDKAAILLRDSVTGDYNIQKNTGFQEGNGISSVNNDFLSFLLEKTQKPVIYEELSLMIRDTQKTGEMKEERQDLEKLRDDMKKMGSAFCLPLFMENKVIGLILLGKKISKDPYSAQDVDLLIALSHQISISLQNALLYSETKKFGIKLEKEVAERTKELKEAYEDLKKLDKAKSEFISIASHQLRTPLTAIKGYISMMMERTYGKPPEKMEKPLKNIYISNERLLKLVNDLLNISRIESGRLELKIEEVSVDELVSSIIEELKNVAKEKEIYLKFEKPEKPSPIVMIDKNMIRQVIMNIIDNAIRYTNQGGITIKIKNLKSKLQIKIADTGEGITEEEIARLFDSFSRGNAGTRFWTEGTGLGLYVAKKFMDINNGTIWAESKGRGKGSAFFIELPVK